MQVISTHFLHDFTRLSDPNEVGIVDKVREEDSEPKKRQLVSGSGVTAKCKGCVYLEEEFADEKCFRRQQTFFGWANTRSHIYSRNKTLTSHPSVHSHAAGYLHFFFFFLSSSVLLHYSRLNVHTRRLMPGLSVFLQTLLMWFWEVGSSRRRKRGVGGEGGQINNVIGPVIRDE